MFFPFFQKLSERRHSKPNSWDAEGLKTAAAGEEADVRAKMMPCNSDITEMLPRSPVKGAGSDNAGSALVLSTTVNKLTDLWVWISHACMEKNYAQLLLWTTSMLILKAMGSDRHAAHLIFFLPGVCAKDCLEVCHSPEVLRESKQDMQVSVMAYSDLPDSIQTVFGICTLHTVMAIPTVRAVIAVFGPKGVLVVHFRWF